MKREEFVAKAAAARHKQWCPHDSDPKKGCEGPKRGDIGIAEGIADAIYGEAK